MRKFSIVMVCAGVFCTAALSSVQRAAIIPGDAAERDINDPKIQLYLQYLQVWVGDHYDNWKKISRGNVGDNELERTFETHFKAKHEGIGNAPKVIFDESEQEAEAETQFDEGKGCKAIDEFFRKVHDDIDRKAENEEYVYSVTFSVLCKDENTLKVLATSKNSLEYNVYEPVCKARKFKFDPSKNNMENCVPRWKSGKFKCLQFNFYRDNKSKPYILSTFFPVFSEEEKQNENEVEKYETVKYKTVDKAREHLVYYQAQFK